MKNCRLLAFYQGCQKNDFTVWKFQRIVMGGPLVLVDLSEDRGPVADHRFVLPWAQRVGPFPNFVREGQLSARKQTNCHPISSGAQKPPVPKLNIRVEDGYKNDFLPPARKAITDNGGKYIAGGFNKTATFDGAPPPNRVVILQFESMDKAKAWNDNQANKDARKIGDKYATFRTFAVEGVPQQ